MKNDAETTFEYTKKVESLNMGKKLGAKNGKMEKMEKFKVSLIQMDQMALHDLQKENSNSQRDTQTGILNELGVF